MYSRLIWHTYILLSTHILWNDTIMLANISIMSHNYYVCFCGENIYKFHPFNHFQVYNTVSLATISMLYTRASETVHKHNRKFMLFAQDLPILPIPSSWQPTLILSLAFSDLHISDYHVGFIFLMYFTISSNFIRYHKWYKLILK